MIESYHTEIKRLLAAQNTDPSDALISWMFVGFAAGMAMALDEPKLAREANRNLRMEWLSISGPGGPYAPGEMATNMAKVLKGKGGGKGGGNGHGSPLTI